MCTHCKNSTRIRIGQVASIRQQLRAQILIRVAHFLSSSFLFHVVSSSVVSITSSVVAAGSLEGVVVSGTLPQASVKSVSVKIKILIIFSMYWGLIALVVNYFECFVC